MADSQQSMIDNAVYFLRDTIGDAETAAAIGIPTEVVAKWGWKSQVVQVDMAQTARILAVRMLVTGLSESLTPRGVCQWLRAHHRLLGGNDGPTALEALANGKFGIVDAAARAFVEGYYV